MGPSSTFYVLFQGVTNETAGESENGFTFNDVLVMFVVDTIVFSILAWYAGNVSLLSLSPLRSLPSIYQLPKQ